LLFHILEFNIHTTRYLGSWSTLE